MAKIKVLQPLILKFGRIANTGDIVDTDEQGWSLSYVQHVCVLKRAEIMTDHPGETGIPMVDKMAVAAPVDKLGKGKK